MARSSTAPSSPRARAPQSATRSAAVAYQVELEDARAHLYRVTLTIAQPEARQRLSLPVWIPGSYLVREFAKHLQELTARQGQKALTAQQLDKCSWAVDCEPAQPLVLNYRIYAYDNSVRAAWLDTQRGFFNATSLCLRVEGREDAPHRLTLPRPHSADKGAMAMSQWQVATGLTPLTTDPQGWGSYQAADYDELADSPVEMGAFWRGDFTACGVPHRFIVAGAPPSFDGARLLADAQRICETEIRFWHAQGRAKGAVKAPPFQRYVFMLNATDDNYGGLEHRNSTALICGRRDLPRVGQKPSEGYTTLLGLISHEYFHTWNVKRLRPAEFARYDYTRENYTELLWFFEGFTSYYDDLLLRRAGLVDDATYLRLLNKNINQLLQTPGRLVQTVAQASLDAWVKYYRVDENTPNATVSYYGKGALVALCIDLTLRAETAHKKSLDDVMRALWRRCKAGPMTESDVLAVLQELSGRSWKKEIQHWVHGTRELPLRELLQAQGVAIHDDPAQLAQRLGLRVTENNGGLQIKTVLRGGAAEEAGFAAGDEWLGVEVPGSSASVGKSGKAKAAADPSAWRLRKLDDLPLYAGEQLQLTALISRDQRILRLPLALPKTSTTWRLAIEGSDRVKRWLG
ncbi:M61 family metallopeptidase [Hylemonella gracilis]|uniref:Peptidase M61 domain-containing protein n=1 Tax=Hylemonella gracilis ATCC 19624 TaxID=887062 RepID=F3KUA4_9BURK|nr:M61 family metallopeptidase [Hylemonella gracilis]EGI76654.1 peptidase M61 domain-containing protein [Hylemonella gracilis ATCC 19624]